MPPKRAPLSPSRGNPTETVRDPLARKATDDGVRAPAMKPKNRRGGTVLRAPYFFVKGKLAFASSVSSARAEPSPYLICRYASIAIIAALSVQVSLVGK